MQRRGAGSAGAATHIVRRVDHLTHAARRRDGAPVGRLAEHDVRGAEHLHGRLADPEHRRDLCVAEERRNVRRAAAKDERDDGALGGRRDGGDERELPAGKADERAVVALALEAQVGADGEDDEVGRGGGGGRRRDAARVVGAHVGHALDVRRRADKGGEGVDRRPARVVARLAAVVVDSVSQIRVGANDDGRRELGRVEGQRAARVLEEHSGLPHAVARELARVGAAHLVEADLCERARRVKLRKPNAHFEEAAQHRVDVGVGDGPVRERRGCVLAHEPAAVDVRAGAEDRGDGLGRGVRVVVREEDVRVGVAVARHVPVKLPRAAQERLEQPVGGAAGHAVDGVVRAHHARHLALLDARLKRREVRVDEVLLRHVRVNVVAVRTIP